MGAASGRPIGEPRSENRYYDHDTNYDDVKKQGGAHVRLPAIGHSHERELGTTIGHLI